MGGRYNKRKCIGRRKVKIITRKTVCMSVAAAALLLSAAGMVMFMVRRVKSETNSFHAVQRRKRNRKAWSKTKKTVYVLASVAVLLLSGAGTAAFLVSRAEPAANSFRAVSVSCRVDEEFDGETKRNVNVTNTGETIAYVRVKLISYRVDESGEVIGGEAEIPGFTPGEGWISRDGFYYYLIALNPKESAAAPLISEMRLSGDYDDADGGRQVVEVMAEAIQNTPSEAVTSAWGFDPGTTGD